MALVNRGPCMQRIDGDARLESAAAKIEERGRLCLCRTTLGAPIYL